MPLFFGARYAVSLYRYKLSNLDQKNDAPRSISKCGYSKLVPKISGALRAPFLNAGIAFPKSLRAHARADANMRINFVHPKVLPYEVVTGIY